MAVFIGAVKKSDTDLSKLSLTELENLKRKLFLEGLKKFPNTKTQKQIKQKISDIFAEIEKRQK